MHNTDLLDQGSTVESRERCLLRWFHHHDVAYEQQDSSLNVEMLELTAGERRSQFPCEHQNLGDSSEMLSSSSESADDEPGSS